MSKQFKTKGQVSKKVFNEIHVFENKGDSLICQVSSDVREETPKFAEGKSVKMVDVTTEDGEAKTLILSADLICYDWNTFHNSTEWLSITYDGLEKPTEKGKKPYKKFTLETLEEI